MIPGSKGQKALCLHKKHFDSNIIILLYFTAGGNKKEMTRVEKALEYHKKGYNCSQAVVCAFCDKVGLTEETAFKVAEALGFGDSDSYGTCGAVTGMALVMGMANSTGNLEKTDSKANTYKKTRELNEKFRNKNGSTICRDIKGMDSGKVLRSCDGCIEDAAAILTEVLGE
jgi:C_GCAxxG_C_C family probable redox protein